MYRNDCRLTCWNQNCDILMHFRTPACQMNDDRQIAAESRQIFNFCSLKLWSYCNDLHQNFTRCIGISIAINSHIYKTMLHFISKCQSKECRRSIWRLQNGAKVDPLPQQHPFDYRKIYCSCKISIISFYQHWHCRRDQYRTCWDIWYEMPIFCRNFCPRNLWGYWTNLDEICAVCRENIAIECFWIKIVIIESVRKCQHVEWRSFHKF